MPGQQYEVVLISAMARRNRVIGNEGGVPWEKPQEYAHFKGLVEGKPVIMGRKTYDIVNKGTGQEYEDAPKSPMFVVSRQPRESLNLPSHVEVCPTLEDAIGRASRIGRKIYVAGGESMYRMALPIATGMELSYVDGDWDGTAHFPDFNEHEWDVVRRERNADEGWDFLVYRRKI